MELFGLVERRSQGSGVQPSIAGLSGIVERWSSKIIFHSSLVADILSRMALGKEL